METQRFTTFFEIIVLFRVKFPTNLTKVLQLSISMNKSLILMFSFNYLVNKANSQKNEKNFFTNAKEIKAFIGINYIVAVNQLPNRPMFRVSGNCLVQKA